jgi:hypothetical protein
MALDALIIATTPHPEGVVLELGPRPASTNCALDGTPFYSPPSIPGQDQLLLVNPSWTPHVGDSIWGGSGFAHIVSGGIEFPYLRQGYFRLAQGWQADA